MIRILFKFFVLLLLLTGGLQSCVNLNHVNNFASCSLKSVKNFEAIDYSFKQNCLENCQDKKINDFTLTSQDCDCKANEKADSVTFLIYNAVKGYLDGLTNLSNNNLTNYKMDNLKKSLTESDLKSIKIEKAHIEAYSKISGILLNAFTNKYRKNKIKQYLKTGNEPFKVLISFLDFNLSANLTGKLNVQKQGIKDSYFDLTKDNTLSTFEKRKAVEEYYQRSNKIDARQSALTTYSKELKKIAAGHQSLVDNIEKMNKDEIKEQLTQYASDIQDLVSEFNKITK
jgi:hypothetical protein